MAYDESRRHTHDPTDAANADGSDATEAMPATDDVFDDPADGEPGRDRLAVHVGWEVLLLLGVACLAFLIHRDHPDALRGAALNDLLVAGTVLGLLAMAAGLTLRAGVPNLALGPVALASAQHVAGYGSVSDAIGPAVLAAVALGLALAVFVTGLHVPAWAASLAVAFAVAVLVEERTGFAAATAAWDPADYSFQLFGGFAALAALAGLFGAVKAIRRLVGRFRPVADPAERRGVAAATVSAGALVVSMVLATLAGVLMGAGPDRPPASGLEWSGLALGAALLGGTSAFGRRGGIFGTVFAVSLLTLGTAYVELRGWEVSAGTIAAAAIVVGLVATRLVESLGRPGSPEDEEPEDWTRPGAGSGNAWSDPRELWSFALPTQPAGDRRRGDR